MGLDQGDKLSCGAWLVVMVVMVVLTIADGYTLLDR